MFSRCPFFGEYHTNAHLWKSIYTFMHSYAGQPTPVSLPGKSYGQRSLVGYNPWGHKELYMT